MTHPSPSHRHSLHVLTPLFVFIVCVVAPAGCSSSGHKPVNAQGPGTCHFRTPASPVASSGPPGPATVPAGTIPGTFSVTSTGEATYVMPLVTVPGRAGVEPKLALAYDSSGDGGVLGAGFSLAGLSAITRCPQNLAQDGEIRGVRYDAADKLCLDGKRLVPAGQTPGTIAYRTFPDTQTKVIGHYASSTPDENSPASALSFEAHTPSGLVIEYGSTDSGKPLAPGGVPQAWLATAAHDGRGNGMSYTYCLDAGDGDTYTAEYALDEITYTSFDGSPSLAATRSVAFVYGMKDQADVRTLYSGGMALQRSLQLAEIQMRGEYNGASDVLVRRYDFTYALGPTTKRTLLTQVEECAGDGVCMPPTRFQYTSSAAGFKPIATSILTPTSTLASPMLLDLDGDGLDDLVVPDTNKALSTPLNPITDWLVARNHGASASPPYLASTTLALSEEWPMVADPAVPDDPTHIQPELGTAIDYDQNGTMDIFVHDVWGSNVNWHVLITQPDHTFKLQDTGIPRPFPLGGFPPPPTLNNKGGSVHLADVDGDGVPDLLQCQDHSAMETGDPSQAAWVLHLWQPAQGGVPAGFNVTGEPIHNLDGFRCDTDLYTVDIDGDGKVDLLVPGMLLTNDGTEMVPLSTYVALTRMQDGSWPPAVDTKLAVVPTSGRLVFLDVNGDGLPDAVESGQMDGMLWTWINAGSTFTAQPPHHSLPFELNSTGATQDTFFNLAVPIDFNSDGRQDILMPVPGGTLPNQSDVAPAWAILQATGATKEGPDFVLVDPHVPFEPKLAGSSITLADPHGPRVGDVNGDGAEDVIVPLNGVFNVFQNLAPDQDLLVAVSDGMNAHDPTDPGFVPDVSFTYGHLTDASITNGTPAGDPALESDFYLSHASTANGCAYPRMCAVGPRRVVSGYTTNNGADGVRHFGVRYRDGRYHRLGRGFLGLGERIVTDLDTLAGTADVYDNVTFTSGLDVFPFVGQVQHEWRWYPGLPSQPNPDQIELSFTDVTNTLVETNGSATYFTIPTQRRIRKEEGVYPNGAAPTIETYVQQVESSNSAAILSDATMNVSSFDTFGNVEVADITTSGVDLTLHITRTFFNDTSQWVLGQLQTQSVCSTASMIAQCRLLTRHTTTFGEVHDEATASDDGSLDTQLLLVYSRDPFGNVTGITASDAYGHQRAASRFYDGEGIFPIKIVNPLQQPTLTAFDPRFGRLVTLTDPNLLVTSWAYDGFGRLGIETRPDSTQTTVTLARAKNGGPSQSAWQVTQRTATTGGTDDTVAFDSLGRPIQWWWHGPEPSTVARVMQVIAYDALGEHVVRRSVPVSEGTPASGMLFDVYAYDAMGREVRHTTPWSAVTQTAYDGLLVEVTDPLMNVTVTEQDALGRAVSVADAAMAVTSYTYGPFGDPFTVTAPGDALTRTTRDAYGRVRQLDDPDRGTTLSTHDGFGELLTSTDALGRVVTFSYDELGRTKTRLDQNGAESLTTTWAWDTAPYGKGKLAQLTSPDGEKSYGYTSLGQLDTITLSVNGESDVLQATLGYDTAGRVKTITYPTPAGAAPFAVTQGYDTYGHVLTVTDSATKQAYWTLKGVDNAGRFKTEVFGNGVTSTRSYFADKQSLQSIVTVSGTTPVQNLAYEYDARRDLTSRTDTLQTQNTTERFRYDPLERLTCAYFSVTENDTAPCALGYGYDPTGNGNLTSKSDVGTLVYGDMLHPHAVTGAGSDSFGYDAVGNQTARPGGATVSYTPFDLPKTITQSSGTVTLAYDGGEQRIRKTTPDAETLYFGDLYQRVTHVAPASTAHEYYVHSPERVVAVVTQGGATPGTMYVHVDHLGSVDVLTNENGAVVEHRSYDPFGQRRNPVWGQPTPASFPASTTVGFTGQESDDELGLVNFKGRIYDPKVGRFLTTDPIVSEPLNGQNWNPYSYVVNNPLNYVDPSGFAYGDGEVSSPGGPIPLPDDRIGPGEGFKLAAYLHGEGPPPPAKTVEVPREAAQSGATTPPVDVSPTGSAAGHVPQLAAVAGVPLSAPGAPGSPLGVPGAPGGEPPVAPGAPVGEALEAPSSGGWGYQKPPAIRIVPTETPGLPATPAKAPGFTPGGLLGNAFFILNMGMIFSGDAPLQKIGPDGIPTNKRGEPYPNVIDPRTGQPVRFPSGRVLRIIPKEERAQYDGSDDKATFIKEWHDRGYPTPPQGWKAPQTQLHHIQPRSRGGDNDFWNLVPLAPEVHQIFTNWWDAY